MAKFNDKPAGDLVFAAKHQRLASEIIKSPPFQIAAFSNRRFFKSPLFLSAFAVFEVFSACFSRRGRLGKQGDGPVLIADVDRGAGEI